MNTRQHHQPMHGHSSNHTHTQNSIRMTPSTWRRTHNTHSQRQRQKMNQLFKVHCANFIEFNSGVATITQLSFPTSIFLFPHPGGDVLHSRSQTQQSSYHKYRRRQKSIWRWTHNTLSNTENQPDQYNDNLIALQCTTTQHHTTEPEQQTNNKSCNNRRHTTHYTYSTPYF